MKIPPAMLSISLVARTPRPKPRLYGKIKDRQAHQRGSRGGSETQSDGRQLKKSKATHETKRRSSECGHRAAPDDRAGHRHPRIRTNGKTWLGAAIGCCAGRPWNR